LVNLSLADAAEAAILRQGAVPPIVGLLSSSVPKLQQQSAMLLSNLLTNGAIREEVRYLSWMDPLLGILQTGDAQIAQQALRCIVNVTFDAHCRFMLVRANAKTKIEAASNRLRDPTVSQLAETAVKNFSVSVPGDVQSEVERALASGVVKKVNAPTAQRSAAVDNAFAGLEDLLGGSAAASSHTSYRTPPPATKPGRDPLDDLNDLLENVPQVKTHTPPPPPTQPARGAAIPKPPAVKPYSAPKPAKDPLDDLLDMSPPPKVNKPASSSGLDDLDTLLGGFSTPSKPSHGTSKPPSSSGLDDIDALLSGIGGGGPSKPTTRSKGYDNDDIDSLLADIGGSKPHQRQGGGESIDDLLDTFGGPSTGRSGHNSGFSAIDDILNGL
jgi:hypothetical protein